MRAEVILLSCHWLPAQGLAPRWRPHQAFPACQQRFWNGMADQCANEHASLEGLLMLLGRLLFSWFHLCSVVDGFLITLRGEAL